jgi:2-dehydropantoate 2-reductase
MQPLGRIAIVGTGSMGGYYGALLVRAGHDVHFLLRSEFEAIKRNGIRITETLDPFHVKTVNAYRDTGAIGPCDLVIVTLKTTANDSLQALLPPLVKENTAILTLQNGLGSDELLARQFGAERVLGGIAFVGLIRTEPGVIFHNHGGKIEMGEFSGPATERTRRLAAAFTESGIPVELSDNLALTRWKKLCWNIPFNGLAVAAGGVDCSVILATPTLRQRTLDLMLEVQAAANKLGLPISDDFLEALIVRTETKMGAYRPSTLIDFEAGRTIEVEAIWGEALRRGKQAGVAMPHLEKLYRLLMETNERLEKAIATGEKSA